MSCGKRGLSPSFCRGEAESEVPPPLKKEGGREDKHPLPLIKGKGVRETGRLLLAAEVIYL